MGHVRVFQQPGERLPFIVVSAEEVEFELWNVHGFHLRGFSRSARFKIFRRISQVGTGRTFPEPFGKLQRDS